MKLKRRRAVEVPPKIKSFINGVLSTPLENIEEPLKVFVWEYDKGEFHHWVDLLDHFDTFFTKHLKTRKDLQLEENFLDSDPPFPREAILQILRVTRIIVENCTNKHFYSSYEKHLSSLLSSADADVVEACLQTLAAFLKKPIGKHVIRDSSLSSKLFALAQGWGGKEEGLGLLACATENESELVARELGSTLHFEFYSANELLDGVSASDETAQGLQIIHLPDVNTCQESNFELLSKLVTAYKVPPSLRFSLFTRLRFARAFNSLPSRQQFTCIRLYAFKVLVQACGDNDELVSFFNTEPEFISELVSLLCYEDAVPEQIRILSLQSLVALSQDRSRQTNVLTAVTSGGHRGILSSLMQKAIDSVVGNSAKWCVVFAEALLSLVTVLVSSSSGCSAMREAGFIPTLLPLLKDTDPQHLHLVSMAVHVLEAFMDYSNPAAALFRDLGGLDETILRLKLEVSHIESVSSQQIGSSSEVDVLECQNSTSSDLDNMPPLYSEAMVAYYQRLLMKALLRAISLGTYAPGSTTRINGSEESLLPHCLCSIFKRAKDFGGGVFSLAATVMSDLIHKDPTCYPVLEAADLPSAFLSAIMDGVISSAEAITCIPQCLDALCLNNNGLQAVKDRNALRCFVKIFTSRTYLRSLAGETSGTLSSGLDELMRHASSLRGPGVDMLIEILNVVVKIGSGGEVGPTLTESTSCSVPVPMETDSEEKNMVPSVDKEVNIETFLPDCITNVARLLETLLQNSDTCRIFIEKKGIEAVLQLFTLPLMPATVSIGQNIAVAFKVFSSQHSAYLARAVCSFLKEHLVSANELLASVGGVILPQTESSNQMKVLRGLSSLDGILSLSNSLLKGTTTVLSEFGTSDADVLRELGRAYREIVWQISLCSEVKVNEKKNIEQEPESAEASVSSAVGRESDDDSYSSIPEMRYMNPFSRNSAPPQRGAGHEFLTVIRSNEGFTRRSRHGLSRRGLARLRGGRTASRHIEALNVDSEFPANVMEIPSQDNKKKSPDVLVTETLEKLASTMRSFFTALVKGFTLPNRRRSEPGSLNSASKSIGSALAKAFLEALSFSGYSDPSGVDTVLSVKCRYLGKIVDDMAALIFDSRRKTCYTVMVNNFYVHGTFKEVLTTFEATSQLLLTLPCHSSSNANHEINSEGGKLSQNMWLLDTLKSYCRLLEHFVDSSLLLSPTSGSQTQLLIQPVAVGLSIGLFPVPKEPEAFVRMLQSHVLDVVLPVWKHPMFPNCSPGFISSIISIVTQIYSGVGDVKRNSGTGSANSNQRNVAPPPDEATIATIIEMGFTRSRAEEALRRVETNSVEMAMEWLFSHAEEPVQDDDELAEALALSLGSSSETSRPGTDKSTEASPEEEQLNVPPIDDVLAAAMSLFQSGESIRFSVMDLLVTLCNRNKGQDRQKVTFYLVQQLKLCPLEFTKDVSALSMVSHILALLLTEDGTTREIASENGVASIAMDILMNFKASIAPGCDVMAPNSISSLLLILDNLVQSKPRVSSDTTQKITMGSQASEVCEKEPETALEKTFGMSTGYLTLEESRNLLNIACDLIKRHVPAVVMQAVLQLCARLTKTHVLALRFLQNDGMAALFSLPRTCFFPGYDTLASAIVRHLIEDPQTLQTAMELEIRQTLTASRHGGRVFPQAFLTSMAPVISRDPEVFMKAAAAVCQLESSGGRTVVVLTKEKEKEKEKPKTPGVEIGTHSAESVRIPETKYSKGHKKIPVNLTQVIDHLLDIVLKYPSARSDEITGMEVDEPASSRIKGKSKIDETKNVEPNSQIEMPAELGKVTFVLKLLSDILLMYVHVVGVVLRRDSEMCQARGSGGIVHHLLHRLIPLCNDRNAGSNEWRSNLSEKASCFLVVLCGRSSEGRKRVINELMKALFSISNLESNTSVCSLLPDRKVLAFVDLVYSILSKNSSSSNLPGSGFSPDIAKSMIDSGMVQSLTNILRVMDLDHPDAPKLVNIIVKALEILTRAANTSEQVLSKSDSVTKKKSIGVTGNPDDQTIAEPSETVGPNQNQRNQQVTEEQQEQGMSQNQDNHEGTLNHDMRIEVEETMSGNPPIDHGLDFMHEHIEDGGVLHGGDQIEMTFHVDNRADEDMGDEDDDMDDDNEEDEDDEGEDEDVGEDGAGLMSLADTDAEDDEAGLEEDEYNDEMADEEDGDFHENRVIEVRWREALDGLDHLQVLGQPGSGSGLFEVSAEPFEGIDVDDLFGLRRSLAFDRRRQTNRMSIEQSVADGSNSLVHPLLSRPSQGDSGGNSSRDLEPPAGIFDLGQFHMFDNTVVPYEHAPSGMLGGRLGRAPADYSVGLESLRSSGRRGPGDGRWTDDGQPQAGGVAAGMALAIEEQFVSHLRNVVPEVPSTTNNPLPSTDNINGNQRINSPSHNDGVASGRLELDQMLESVSRHEEVSTENTEVEEPSLSEVQAEDIGVNSESMDVGEGDETMHEQAVDPDTSSARETQPSNPVSVTSEVNISSQADTFDASVTGILDVDMNSLPVEENQIDVDEPPSDTAGQSDQTGTNNVASDSNTNAIDPTFLEALPEDLRAEVLASQQARSAPPPTYEPPTAEDIDPEFLAALPPDIQAEVLAQQRARRVTQQAEGQPVDMDNASIIATFPADLREEVLLTSSEAVLSALPSSLLAEAQMLRDRAMSHYQARSIFGNSHRLNSRRNGLGFDRHNVMDRGVGVTIGRRASNSLGEGLKLKEIKGDPLLDLDALKALVRLLRLAQPLGKGLLQRLLLNLCTNGVTRATLVWLLLEMVKPETESPIRKLATDNAHRLYGCQSNIVYGRSQLLDGLPPLVLRRILELLAYLATNHSAVASILFHFDSSLVPDLPSLKKPQISNSGKGKEKIVEEGDTLKADGNSQIGDIPLILLLKLLTQPRFLRSSAQLELVMGLIQAVVYTAASKLESQSHSKQETTSVQNIPTDITSDGNSKEINVTDENLNQSGKSDGTVASTSDGSSSISVSDIFLQLPQADLQNLCNLLGHEGLSDKVYLLAGAILKKLATVATPHRKQFILELSKLANSLSNSAINELVTLRNTHMLGLSSGSMSGLGVLRVLQTLCSLASPVADDMENESEIEEHAIMSKLSVALQPLWQELSNCISSTESDLALIPSSSTSSNTNIQGHAIGSSSPPLPPGTQRLLPFIEAFFVLCEKIQASNYVSQNDHTDTTAREVKESAGSSTVPSPTRVDSQKRLDGTVIFSKFAEKHRRLLNAFVRQNPSLLEKSLSIMLKAPRLIEFDNKKTYFRSKIRQQHEQHLSGPLRISVRRAYVLEDSYNQLRMRPTQDLKGRLNVHFQGEEGIDAGGLTREWYQLLSRVIFDKGALLFTTVGNNSTFQPNPNSVYQTEHLSYFKFVGRVVAKALFDAQLLDVYFTRSFYKHILGVKVTYHDIEAVDPDYYKNLKWMLENDVNDILDLTFSMDADEEKRILYEKTEVSDYELKPGGRNIRVTEETKHEYVDLVADHILTNAIRPQINAFLEGFNELVPRELISIFNDKELELLISGLPEIEVDDLKANTEYTGYSAASSVIKWFWEVVKAFNKEDMARFLQFVTGTSKVPLEGFKALQGISGPQRFQIHKAYGAPQRLPSAHTCFNQLDLPEYTTKEQLEERLLLAIHEANEGFGFG